ncbi:MAG: hypothetical protein J7501_18130, partial [Bdellovibrio sp.]|nr:hypothetical protein [Bdellovibrio sp.]
MRKLIALIIAFNLSIGSFAAWAKSTDPAVGQTKVEAVASIDYLLSIDRLHFYTQNLADFLDGKKSEELISVLRSITPEDIHSQNLSKEALQTPASWQRLVFDLVQIKSPQTPVTMTDLEWNYNFFKNKLMDRFAVKSIKASKEMAVVPDTMEEAPSLRSVPKIKGTKY